MDPPHPPPLIFFCLNGCCCRQIGSKRNVLIVGDSINQQIYWTLLNNLNKEVEDRGSRAQPDEEIAEVCSDVLPGGEGFKLGFVRNDRLSLIPPGISSSIPEFHEFPWVHYLKQWEIQILVLNRGAHYEADEVYTQALRDAFSLLQAQYPHLLVVYRDTPPGTHTTVPLTFHSRVLFRVFFKI